METTTSFQQDGLHFEVTATCSAQLRRNQLKLFGCCFPQNLNNNITHAKPFCT